MKKHFEVLLVEDSSSDAQIIESIVSSSDLEQPNLTHTERFADALTMLSSKAYDLILLDLHLPDGDGVGLITQLQQQVPTIPIVVITGLQDEAMAAAALQEGAQDYVMKSDTICAKRLSKLGHTDVGNWLVRRINYAVHRAKLSHQLEGEHKRAYIIRQEKENGLWDWDLKTNCLYCSPKWKTLLGIYGPTSNHINDWFSRIHPADRPRFQRILQDYLTHRPRHFYCEYRIQHTNGDYLWVVAKGHALWGKTGSAYRMMGSQADITARKHEEHAATSRKELTQKTLHTVGAGLLSLQATFYLNEGKYYEAEPLLKSTLEIQRALQGNNHPNVGISLYNLAALYDNLFRFQEAESLFRESLTIFQKSLGPKHPYTQKIKTKVDMICRLNQALEHNIPTSQRGLSKNESIKNESIKKQNIKNESIKSESTKNRDFKDGNIQKN